MNLVDRLTREAVHGRLSRIRHGRLVFEDEGSVHAFGNGDGPLARVRVKDPSFYRATAFGGPVGAAEAFMRGAWACDDLPALVRILVRNREALRGLDRGWARLAAPVRRLAHARNRNTREGSGRNIRAHYDLGNDFFSLFLDDTLTYSCGIFEHPGATLREASIAKYDRLCRKLDLKPADHVVEIGSGWGGFAIHAASRYGCRVTTTTISREQHALATERVAAAGLADRVAVLREDYRDLEGRFDKLVSIEMIEAVGHEYHGVFFRKCADLLAPDGLMALQAITIGDKDYDEARRTVDFIKRYVFPGGCLPSVAVLCAAAATTDLRPFHLEDITPHYAETLRRWRANFLANRERMRALDCGEEFLRLWEFYLSYCEGAFEERHIGDVQMVFAKPLSRREPIL
ncbi:MAG: cyclopropane-fatty-acyl-phospholipid synthase family protein [Planctomycetes bacterium]|nr:cyclopropane-fatty-acyl-phospholipid synthase family protein [Planctomycetota bacterium]